MKTLAIFGTGPGLGISTARRFGRESHRVALVSRNAERLKSFVDDLAADGVEAAAFTADLVDRSTHAAVVAAVTDRFGPIDVAVLNSYFDLSGICPILDMDPESMLSAFERVVLAPVSLTRLLVPGMLERGDGGLLYGLGGSARTPMPLLAAPGSAQAGLRNYVLNLHTELAARGVYAGALTISKLIERSDAQGIRDAGPLPSELEFAPERADPDDLAEDYWRLYTRRDRAELVIGDLGAA
jgi:short-subunit dehydrogenase